jgi:hypothetical protein
VTRLKEIEPYYASMLALLADREHVYKHKVDRLEEEILPGAPAYVTDVARVILGGSLNGNGSAYNARVIRTARAIQRWSAANRRQHDSPTTARR